MHTHELNVHIKHFQLTQRLKPCFLLSVQITHVRSNKSDRLDIIYKYMYIIQMNYPINYMYIYKTIGMHILANFQSQISS